MRSADEIWEQAKRLPREEQEKLAERLDDTLSAEESDAQAQNRKMAMERLLARAGTGQSDHADVSSDKYKHLAEIYASKP